MSWTKRERILVTIVLIIIFILANIFSNIVIKNKFGVDVFDEKYKDKIKVYYKADNIAQYPHPFFGLASIGDISIENSLTSEPLFTDITHIKNETGPKILIIGGSVASTLSNNCFPR